jgi:hypothetical protein
MTFSEVLAKPSSIIERFLHACTYVRAAPGGRGHPAASMQSEDPGPPFKASMCCPCLTFVGMHELSLAPCHVYKGGGSEMLNTKCPEQHWNVRMPSSK